MKPVAPVICLLLLWASAIGCSHKRARVDAPEPPPISPSEQPSPQPGVAVHPSADQKTLAKMANEDKQAIEIPADAKPLLVQTGIASWYGAPYHNHRGSNGEIYDMYGFTAAHLTLPLGSIVRVTNVKTLHTTLVRITDRGPFVDGRIIDLSLAAARKVDVWQPGTAEVKLEVMQTPSSLDVGGRWAVQVGGFSTEAPARELSDQLSRRYQTAKVLCFVSPVGEWWVRVRVLEDDRKRAEEVAKAAQVDEGSIFLVRLD